jgi:D-alanyl-D-alanine dipeptidase
MIQVSAQKEITFIADPCVLAIPIQENNEPLVDIKDQTSLAYGPSPEIPNNTDYTKMRKSVYERLIHAQNLLPQGLKICLYEGYRSLELQQTLFENRWALVQKLHPNWSHEQLFKETTRIVSPVINEDGSPNIPPHGTGAAVDVYLIDEKGQILDMGIHAQDWMQDKDGSISQTDSQKISTKAQENRRIMNTALSAAGFANYPTEYWHWSYGDRYWAYQLGKPHAIYGCVDQFLQYP